MALDRLTKVDGGGISTTSNYRVGIITATKFVGPIEGSVTGSITATDGTFSGDVSIGGTLTYEDVTNIDSVGIITARDGIHITGDNKYLKIGAGDDLQLVHTGGETYIANSTGHLTHRSDVHKWENLAGSSEYLRIDSSGSVIVNNTTATAGSYTYKLLASDNISSTEQTFGIQYPGVVTYGLNAESNADFTIKKDGAERLRIASDGATKVCHNGGAFGVGGTPINKFGVTSNGNDFFGLHRGNATTGTGEFNINIETNSQVTFSMDDEGAFSFGTSTDPSAQSGYSEKLRITSGGSVLIDTTVTTEASTDFDDLIIGSTSDTAKGISIVGSTTGGVGSLAFTDGASYKNQGVIQYRHADDSMRFHTNQYERLRIDSSGRIGIGTDNPQKQLQILGDADTCLRITSSSNGVASLQLGDVNDTVKGAITFKNNDNSLRIRGHNNDDRIIIDSSGRSLFRTNGSQTTPVTDNNVPVQIAESTGGYCYFGANKASSYGSIFGHHTAFGGTVIRNLTSDNIVFYTNNTQETLRITSDGDVSISSSGTVYGVSKLTILPADRTSAFSASDGDTWHDVVLKQTGSAANNAVGIAFQLHNNVGYHKNAGTGIAAVKNGTNSDYGSDLVFITRPQSAVAEERLRITSDGKLGVNNASPDSALSIAGTGSDAATRVSIKDGVGISNVVGRYGNLVFQADVDNAINGSVMVFEIDGSEAFRVDSSRQIGIGTITPGGDLHIYDGDSSARIYITSDNDEDSSIYFGRVNDTATAAIRYEHSSDSFDFYGYNNSKRLSIASGGFVKINSASPVAGTNGENALLQVKSTSQYDGLLLGHGYGYGTIGTSNAGALIYTGNASPGNLGGTETITHDWWSGSAGGGGPNRVMALTTSGKLTVGDGNNLASNYGATMLIDGGDNTKLSIYASSTGGGTLAFPDGSGSNAAKMAGFIQMNHTSNDNGPRLMIGQNDTSLVHIRVPGSNRGQLEIYGSFNESTVPAIEINHNNDARKVFITNSAGDLNLLTRNGSQTKGQLKMFESGVFFHAQKDPDSTNVLQTFKAQTYRNQTGSTNPSITPDQTLIQKGGSGTYDCFYEGNMKLEVNGTSTSDHYQPVAFVPLGYDLDTSSFGGQWAGEMWIHQTGSQNPVDYGYNSSSFNNWATMTFKCRWDCAHWNAKPNMFFVEHYINTGRGNIGKIDNSSTMSQFVIYLLPGFYQIRYNCVRGMAVHRASSAGGSITLRDGGSMRTYDTLAYSSRNTSFDSEISLGSSNQQYTH